MESVDKEQTLIIIAVGASAGGLQALQSFLSNLSQLDRSCVIIAQHLSPTHKSRLVDLLSKNTELNVVTAENDALLQENHVYITPPEHHIQVAAGKIELSKAKKDHLPKPSVDTLFESLAEYHPEQTIGVILSGTGSDGAEGIKRLKSAGAHIIVQEPETAKYNGMPLSAIHTGCVDGVFSPDKIGEEIHDFIANPKKVVIKEEQEKSQESSYHKILKYLRDKSGIDFSSYKKGTIGRRLDKQIAIAGIDSIDSYWKYLQENPNEADRLFQTILIGVTSFFRDKESFQLIDKHLGELLKSKKTGDAIRIWVPGCSTGEEAYSYAILLLEHLGESAVDYGIQIFATDIDKNALSKARAGFFSNESLENIDPQLIDTYFSKTNKGYVAKKTIRSLILFSRHDLISDPPFLNQDLISCRNLLIYFDASLHKRIIPLFHYALNDNGFLFLGKSETVGHFNDLFSTVDGRNKLYKRKVNTSQNRSVTFASYSSHFQTSEKKVSKEQKVPTELSIDEKIKETLYNTYEYPFVIIRENLDLVEVFGDVRLFLTLPSGEISQNLIKLVNEELKIELRDILLKTIKHQSAQNSRIKRFTLFNQEYFVRLNSKPLLYSDSEDRLYMVTFEQLDIDNFIDSQSEGSESNKNNVDYKELERELAYTKEQLQTYIEELETSNEELQALNEELQSTNEELNSTNEELETSNEELQSTNEEVQVAYQELQATNTKLQSKEKLLKQQRSNLNALLSNSLQGFILVKRNFEIQLFNKKAEEIFLKLKGERIDEKYSILDFIPENHEESFLRHFRKALKGEVFSDEQELTGINGDKVWFTLNYTPVKYEEGEVSAVSVAIKDITKLKQTLSELDEKERLVNSVFDATALGICITDQDGIFVDANKTYCDIYGYKKDEIIGRHFTMMVPPGLRGEMQQLHDDFIAGENEAPGEFDVIDKEGKELKVAFQAQRLIRKDGSVCKVTSIRDITQETLQRRQIDVISGNLPGVLLQYVLYKDNSDALLSVSSGAKRIFGISAEDFVEDNTRYWERVHPDDVDGVTESIRESAEKMETWRSEWRFLHDDGTTRWHQGTGEPRTSQDYDVKAIWDTVILDITELRVHEEQRLLLESAVTNSSDAIIITEAQSTDSEWPEIVFVNEAFTTTTGYSFDEAVGNTLEMLKGKNTNYDELQELDEVTKDWVPFERTTINYKKDGEAFWVSYKISPIYNNNGKHTHWVIVQRDVTRQKNSELQKELLFEVRKIFNDGHNFKKTLDLMTEHIALFGGFDVAELWLVDEDEEVIELYSKNAIDDRYKGFHGDQNVQLFNINQGLPGTVWANKEALLINNLSSSDSYVRRDEAHSSGIKSAFGVPIFHQDRVIAVILLGSSSDIPTLAEANILLENFQNSLGSDILRKRLEEEMRIMYDTSPDIICIMGFDGVFKRVNHAAVKILGYSEEELTSKPYLEFVHPDDQNNSLEEEKHILKGKGQAYFENRYIKSNGEIVWLAWSSTLDADNEVIYAVGKDITEVKHIQHLLNEATDLAKIGAWEMKIPERTLYWSPNTCAMHDKEEGYSPDLEEAINFYKEGEHREKIRNAVEEAIRNKESYDMEAVIITAGGSEKWVRTIGKPEFANGEFVKLTGSIQDINKRKTAELNATEALREKETILESIGDAFFSVDRDWIVTYWNAASEELLNVSKDEVLGKELWEIFPEAKNDIYYLKYKEAFATGKSTHFQAFFDVLEIWLDISAYPDQDVLSVYYKDITEQKEIEDQLKLSNERFDLVTKATNDAIWDWDFTSNTMFWGRAFETLTGVDINELEPSYQAWTSFIHPDDIDNYKDNLSQILKDKSLNTLQNEYRVQCEKGITRHVVDRSIIMRDEEGKPIRAVGAITDLTDQKKYQEELELINVKLDKRAKELAISNAELEQFAYVASHDLQEPLRMVTSFLTQLEKKYKDQLDDKALTYIKFAVDGGKRMRNIILDLLDFSRVGKYDGEPEKVDLFKVVEESLKLHQRVINDTNATIHVSDDFPVIEGYYTPILQIFQNLIGNALKYRKEKFSPEISISVKEKNDEEYEFAISDNGIGIDPKYHDKIFVIFQRLHARDKYGGTGMGLAIVKKILDVLGGDIRLESEVDNGSTFYITLPKSITSSSYEGN